MIDETDAAGETPDDGDLSGGTSATDAADGTSATDAAEPAEPPKAGVLTAIAAFARTHRLPLMIAGGVVALGLLGTGAVVAGVAGSGAERHPLRSRRRRLRPRPSIRHARHPRRSRRRVACAPAPSPIARPTGDSRTSRRR
ncbi:hypothetical protein [Agromyces laixinhei]|uniref:hypothetical protein n=1 Tax=Agromyces laixinhei TaxID=2585717 RepID=UPI001F1B7134|nr:hypothetical protein [Agromyces laixinhei]